MTEAQKRAKKKYKAQIKRFTVEFYPTETELFYHLAKQENKQGYIKQLIRENIKKDGE